MQRLEIQGPQQGKYVASLRAQLSLIQKIKECHMADAGVTADQGGGGGREFN